MTTVDFKCNLTDLVSPKPEKEEKVGVGQYFIGIQKYQRTARLYLRIYSGDGFRAVQVDDSMHVYSCPGYGTVEGQFEVLAIVDELTVVPTEWHRP